ncbi:MAG: aldo/keto reductase [Candidatus Cloacimonetes bacterium]|nr:aldo/keto reductase [Candidatus Cloacimonadota bacterium]
MKFANILSTKELIQKFETRGVVRSHRTRSILRSEVMTTQLGFGTYRVHVDSPEHETSMVVALQSGVNLIDTSSNYGYGGSEELISKVLDKMSKEDSRDSFIIVTKSGYIQGALLEQILKLDLEEQAKFEAVKLSENCWHSVHPDILLMQMEQSLKRMNIDALDVMLLHNPEYFLQDCQKQGIEQKAAQEVFYARVKKSFLFLESQVQAKKIKYYGVSSNTLCLDETRYDRVSLSKLNEIALECAQELYSNDKHNFQVIQFPCNLFESKGAIDKNNVYQGQEYTTIELANTLKLDVLFNRPLNAFHEGRLIRLAQGDYNPDLKYSYEIEQAFKKIDDLENSAQVYFDNHKKVIGKMREAARRTGFFEVVKSLPDFVEKCRDNEEYFQMVQTWLWPYISTSLDCFHKFFEGDEHFDLSQFTNDYLKSFDALEKLIIQRNNQFHVQYNLDPIKKCLSLDDSIPFSQVSLNILASLPGKPVVLNGMRDLKWVKDSTSILIEDQVSSSVELLKEIRDSLT